MSDSVLCERKEGVAWITLNRPDAYNAITVEFMQRLIGCLDAAEADADIGVVVITGAGKAWCA
ncbi:MAG: enoyl-CoA hydratase/isomerase family protein [Deltaproteobacteria bacterium]|nr:enoyl-CoA hydratase/isomerase family protein [Deltaproteobacteria bacterium]